jgi:hypothetical protein
VYDFLDIIGVPDSARAVDVRWLTARYVRRCHPDFERAAETASSARLRRDAAIDSVSASTFVDRILDDFFSIPD